MTTRGPRRRMDYSAVLAGLKTKPGKWALVDHAERSTSSSQTLRAHYGIDVVTRRDAHGVHVWASWPVAGPSSAAVAAVESYTKSGAPVPTLPFGSPPQRRQGGRRPTAAYDALAAMARSRPGSWLVAGKTDRSGRVSMALSLRKRGCEVTTREDGGACRVWVRWPAKRRIGTLPVLDAADELWDAPPVRHQRKGRRPTDFDYLGVAEAVFRRPGRWARVWEGPAEDGPSVRQWFSAQGFNVATRKTIELESQERAVMLMRLWVRWPEKMTRQRTSSLQRKFVRRETSSLPPLQWCNPPRVRSGGSKYEPLIAELKSNAGKWALIGSYSPKEAARVYQGLRRSGCEVTSRATRKSQRGIWARWPK